MDSLPNFLTHGAPLRARESSAINDLPNASNLLKTFLFADDTSFLNSHKDPNQLIRVNDHELGIIKNIWMAKSKQIITQCRQNKLYSFSIQAKTHNC